MQTEHYMANMGRLTRADQPDAERVGALAGPERQPVVAAPHLPTGRSTTARSGDREHLTRAVSRSAPPRRDAAR